MKLRTLLLLSALTLAAPVAVFAENAQTNQSDTEIADGPSSAVLQHLADGRIAYIEAALNLSADQQKLWQPVADLLRQQQTERMHKAHQPGQQPDLSEILARQAHAMNSRAEYDQKLAMALKSLESSLSAEQKQTLKIAFFASAQHMEAHRMTGGFWHRHHGVNPQSPDQAPTGNGSQAG